MVAYGPWTQEPDYEVQQVTQPYNRVEDLYEGGMLTDREQYLEYMDYTSAWYAVSDVNLQLLFENTMVSAPNNYTSTTGTNLGRSFANKITRDHAPGTVGGNDWGSGGTASLGYHPWLLKGGSFGWEPEDRPEDAIGIEYQGVPVPTTWGPAPNFDSAAVTTPVGVRLLWSTKVKALNLDQSDITNHQATGLKSSPMTHLIAANAFEWNDEASFDEGEVVLSINPSNAGATYTLGFLGHADHDLTHHLPYITAGGMVIYTRTPYWMPPQYDDNNFPYRNQWDYGWWIEQLHIGWTLRPPVYRWVYNELPVITGQEGGTRRRFT